MKHEELEKALSLYALDLLEPVQASELETHLTGGCPDCHALLRQYKDAACLLPYALPNRALPKDLKSKVLAAIRGETPPEQFPPWRPLAAPDLTPASQVFPLAAATQPDSSDKADQPLPPTSSSPSFFARARRTFFSLSLILALSSLLFGAITYVLALRADRDAKRAALDQSQKALARADSQSADLIQRMTDLQRELVKAQTDLTRAVEALAVTYDLLAERDERVEVLQKALRRYELAQRKQNPTVPSSTDAAGDTLQRLLTSPSLNVIAMTGTDIAKEASAVVFLKPETRSVFFFANNLPPVPVGKTYQLWVAGEKPVSAGVFSLDDGLRGRMIVQEIPDITGIKQAFVSLEPAGGRPQPSGDIYLSGTR